MSSFVTAPWEDTLRDAYLEGRASIFVLHGAVADFQLVPGEAGAEFGTLAEAAAHLLGRSRALVIRVSGAGDGVLVDPRATSELGRALAWARPGTREPSTVLQGGPSVLLPVLGRLLRTPGFPCGVVVEQAELLVGQAQDTGTRASVAAIRTWVDAPSIRKTNNAAILIVDDPARLSPLLSNHPRLLRIPVGAPSTAMRVAAMRGDLGPVLAGVSDHELAAATRDMSLMQVAALCTRLANGGRDVTLSQLRADPDYPFDPTDVPPDERANMDRRTPPGDSFDV